ncbi:hypothetical protein [Legionella sp. km772]|uniref:hypothetical protein n=1 Tax=Legionella sp. km772 TaxID=2498111 RepID=UPI000F8F416C|nr:hypothetical protein [Legionella sp. km772]RUR13271.1 hypothetical protein ELY15_02750 [Legionella sp. km772]
MAVMNSIQQGVSDFTMIIGTGLKYGGAGGLFAMAVVGTISIDLVLLTAAERNRDSFLTGFILGSMFSRGNVNPIPLLIASPITSAIAVGLSFALGVPGAGLAILAGWALAATLLAVGLGLENLAKAIEPEPESSYRFSY